MRLVLQKTINARQISTEIALIHQSTYSQSFVFDRTSLVLDSADSGKKEKKEMLLRKNTINSKTCTLAAPAAVTLCETEKRNIDRTNMQKTYLHNDSCHTVLFLKKRRKI